MKRIVLILIILISTIIVGCSKQYNNEDVVAKVGDKKITIADIRLFYNLEEKELNPAVKEYVKEEIMVQEAKKLEIDVSKEIKKLKELNTPFPNEQTSKQKKHAQKEAKELGMTEEEYYQKYLDLHTERSAYIMAFIEKNIGEINKEDNSEEYTKRANDFVDSLLTMYSDNIEILVK